MATAPQQHLLFAKAPWPTFLLLAAVFFTLGVLAASSLYLRRASLHINIIGILGWLVLSFQAWAFLSLAWSDYPSITFRRLTLFAMLWVTALAVSQRFEIRDIVLWIFFSTVCYLHYGILAEIVNGTFRPLEAAYRFAGTMHPNSQGLNCALLFTAALFLAGNERRRRGIFAVIACEALILLLLTKSRTSLGAVLLTLLVGYFVTSTRSRQGVVLLTGLSVSCLGLLFADSLVPSLQPITTLGRPDSENLTLTGRIPLWEEALPYIAERPVQGYGYEGFWTPRHIIDFSARLGWIVPNAHSTYVDLCLGVGLMGGALYVLFMIAGIWRAVVFHKASQNPYYSCLGAVLLFVVMVGMTESVLFRGDHLTFVVMLIVCALAFSNQPSRFGRSGSRAQWQVRGPRPASPRPPGMSTAVRFFA
jgi:exopolysaccharide production protein ExoQ